MGGSSEAPQIYYPPETAAETSLKSMELDQLQKAEALEAQLEPFYLQQAGLKKDASGNISRMTPEEQYYGMSPEEQQAYDLRKMAGEREMAAMKGELPIPADVEKQLGEREREFKQQMATQIGPGWESSTPGMQAEATQRESDAALLDSIRRGEMTGMEAISSSEQNQLLQDIGASLSAASMPISSYLTGAGATSTPISEYADERATTSGLTATQGSLQQQRDIAQTESAQSSATGGCCWTFIAGKMLTDPVRRLRNKLFPKDSFVAKGYTAMSNWLVPIMERNDVVLRAIQTVMLKPISKFCYLYETKENKGEAILLVSVCYFWTGLWNLYGRFKIVCG